MIDTAKTIQKKTAKAIFWSITELAGAMVVQFVLGILLARLLSPAEFGVIGMINIFLALSLLFIDSGLGQALIFKKDATKTDENTLFCFNVAVGMVVAVAMAASGGWIADFYRMPQLKSICMVLALNPLFNAFGIVQFTLLKKTLNFCPMTYVTLTAVALSGVAGVIAAYCGLGVWALVLQNLLNNFLRTVLLWILGGWRPSWQFSWHSFRELGTYGSKVLASGMTEVVFKNLYSVIIGKLYTSAMLGFYNKAYSLEQLPGRFLQNIIARVSFSSFASLNGNSRELKRHFRESLRLFLVIALPTMALMGLLARPLVLFLITDKWGPAVPFLQILCVSSPLYLLQILEGNLLKALGFPGIFFVQDVLKKALLVILVCFFYNRGVETLIWIDAGATFVAFLMMRMFNMHQIRYEWKEQLQDCLPYAGLTLLMGCGVFVLSRFTSAWAPFWQLAAGGATGAVLYLTPGIFFREPLMTRMVCWGKHLCEEYWERIGRRRESC